MGHLEVTAHLKIRPGQLEGFKTQVAEIMRLSREQDTHRARPRSFPTLSAFLSVSSEKTPSVLET